MKTYLEVLLEMDFCTKPPNFGVETHMKAPAGDALRAEVQPAHLNMFGHFKIYSLLSKKLSVLTLA
jgi:hypothetical protein